MFVLVLRGQGGRVNAAAFLVGWAAALAVLFFIGFAAFDAGGAGHASADQKTWLSIVEVLLAVVLLIVAARRWQHRHLDRPPPTTPQTILRQVERLTPRRSSVLGVLIQPRTLTLAAAVIVARDRSGPLSAIAGLGVFALLSTIALLGIFMYTVRRPDQAETALAEIAERIEQAGPTLVTIACALGGGYLLIKGVYGLT